MTNENETNASEMPVAETNASEMPVAETNASEMPEAVKQEVREPTPRETANLLKKEARKASRSKASAKSNSAKGGKAKAAEPAATETGKASYTKPFEVRGTTFPAGSGAPWVKAICEGKRLVLTDTKVDWPAAAAESGKAAVALLKQGPKAGTPFASYAGSLNRLGYLIRKGAVVVRG